MGAPRRVPAAAAAARFGQRLRAQLLRDAAAVIVGTEAVARAARRLLRIQARPAPRRAPRARGRRSRRRPAASRDAAHAERPRRVDATPRAAGRYLVYSGPLRRAPGPRHAAARAGRAGSRRAPGRRSPPTRPWPPRVLLAGATPDDRAALARAAAREGVGEALVYAPRLAPERLAGARPRSPARRSCRSCPTRAGLAAIEAIADRHAGRRLVGRRAARDRRAGRASSSRPRDADRLATALRTVWTDDASRARLAAAARERATWERRTWADVADGTRAVYAAVGRAAPERSGCRAARRRPRALGLGGGVSEPGTTVIELGPRDHLDERLADGQRDRVAGLVEELRRLGLAGLSPRALDRLAVRRDPGLAVPMTSASSRCFWSPSLSGPKVIRMTTTFFGRDPLAVAGVDLLPSRRLTERGRCWSRGRSGSVIVLCG